MEDDEVRYSDDALTWGELMEREAEELNRGDDHERNEEYPPAHP